MHIPAVNTGPGCSIAVVDRDGLLWADGFGFADLRGGRRARAVPVYHLFSGTLLFTATAVMKLAEQGRLALDDPIARHLPEAAALRGVTVRHLLSHRSGLKESLRGLLAAAFPGQPPLTAEEALRAFPLTASRPPGERVEYRNTNYALLGVVIARVSGMEYRRYVAEHILRPLRSDCAEGGAADVLGPPGRGTQAARHHRCASPAAVQTRDPPQLRDLPAFHPPLLVSRGLGAGAD